MAELVDYKNELNTHVVKNNLIDKIVEKINKIPKHHELRLNPELILLVCNIVGLEEYRVKDVMNKRLLK